MDDLTKQLAEAKKMHKQNDKELTLKDKIINNLEEKLQIKDRLIHHLNQDIDQSKQEDELNRNDELHRENEGLQDKLKQLEKESKELKQHNEDLKIKLNFLTAKNQDKRIMIIGDSNTRHITDQLINITSHDIQNLHAFTLEKALDLIPTISEDQMTKTTVYLLVGTNNIKRGETARECADIYQVITDMIVEKAQNVTVIQLPPPPPPPTHPPHPPPPTPPTPYTAVTKENREKSKDRSSNSTPFWTNATTTSSQRNSWS